MADRLPRLIGLTGSIGMGKTETAKLFAALGVPVYDSDEAVHRLYEKGGAAVPLIAAEFPETTIGGAVVSAALTEAVTARPDGFKVLEQIVHPLVAREQQAFLHAHRDADMVVLDVPLLFETGGHTRMDAVVVVSAPAAVQRGRVLARPGMSEEKLDSLLSRQLADAEKRAHADFVVETDKGLDHAREQVEKIIRELHQRWREEGAKTP